LPFKTRQGNWAGRFQMFEVLKRRDWPAKPLSWSRSNDAATQSCPPRKRDRHSGNNLNIVRTSSRRIAALCNSLQFALGLLPKFALTAGWFSAPFPQVAGSNADLLF
jgi:hypothetical protein